MRNYNESSIIFFNSPIYKEKTEDGEDYLPPLGQGYIVSQLHKDGIDAEIIDCVNDRLGVEEIVTLINDSLCINIAFNVFSVNMSIIKEIVDKVNRSVNWYFGGKAMRFLWPIMSKWNWKGQSVTYTIGECELIYTDLLFSRCQEKPIATIENQRVYQIDKNSVYYPENLDEIELDRSLFYNRTIINHYKQVESAMITSRGCLYNCAFCGGARYANNNELVRERSDNAVISEIKDIIKANPDVNSVRILDDLFLKNRNSIHRAISIWNRFPGITWRCMAHISSLKANTDLFLELKRSGCKEVFVGIESGSPRIRHYIHKEGTILDIENTISQLLRVGIDVKGYFICGFPTETEQDMEATISLADKLRGLASNLLGSFRATAFQFRPYHGTELFDKLAVYGEEMEEYRIVENSSSKRQYSYVVKNFSEVTDEYLENCIKSIIGI